MTKDEFDSLKSQIATSNNEGRGGRRKLPFCFTEPGLFEFLNNSCYPKSFIIQVETIEAA